jgi:hypothetical protein
MGFGFKAHKGGKNGFDMGSCVVGGVTTEREEGKNDVLVFHFCDSFPEYAYEYAVEHEGEQITLAELVIYAVEKMREKYHH